jgi:hypothetical protein
MSLVTLDGHRGGLTDAQWYRRLAGEPNADWKALGELDPIDRLRDLRDKPHSRAVLDENRPAGALDNTLERLPRVAHESDLGFVYDDDSRIPDLVERVMYDSTSGVSQASVFPAQNYGNVSREGLLCAVDAIDVDEEYIDRNLSWPRVGVRPTD